VGRVPVGRARERAALGLALACRLAATPFVLDAPIVGDPATPRPADSARFTGALKIVHAVIVRPRYVALPTAPRRARAAEERLRARRQAVEIASRPGTGARDGDRPPRPAVADGGVVDVNPPPDVLERLPGIDAATARRIAQVRVEVDGFSSLADLGMTLELDGPAVGSARARGVPLTLR
jgi:hypothetical protein